MTENSSQEVNQVPLGNDLASWLTYIEALHPKSIEMGLARVKKVFDQLHIQLKCPVITVGGTNGKGSTCAILERIYTEAGYRVACYSSPHFIQFNERIRINLQNADDATIVAAFQAIESARIDTQLTYFEFSTLAAFWIFSKQNIDVAILEIGLGGRLDAVNVIESNCAIVTSIDLDHMDYLGATREKIGFEKAGIYRANIPAICGDTHPPKTLSDYAAHIQADYLPINQAFQVEIKQDTWNYVFDQATFKALPKPALKGAFQIENAACVLTAITKLQTLLPVSEEAIHQGLLNVRLLGRFQQIKQQPSVLVDVAHNPHAAFSLAHNLASSVVSGKTIAVFAMLADKDINGVILAVGAQIDAWYIATIATMRGANAQILQQAIKENYPTKPVYLHESIVQAYESACLQAGENDRIIAFGSFYTVAAVLQVKACN